VQNIPTTGRVQRRRKEERRRQITAKKKKMRKELELKGNKEKDRLDGSKARPIEDVNRTIKGEGRMQENAEASWETQEEEKAAHWALETKGGTKGRKEKQRRPYLERRKQKVSDHTESEKPSAATAQAQKTKKGTRRNAR